MTVESLPLPSSNGLQVNQFHFSILDSARFIVVTYFSFSILLDHYKLFATSTVFFTSGLVLFSSKLFWTNGDQGWLKAYDILSNSTEERYFIDASQNFLLDLDDVVPLGHLSLQTDLIACSFLIALSRLQFHLIIYHFVFHPSIEESI